MILTKTENGQQVFKDRSVRLSPRQRSAFILCDGKRLISDVLEAGMGITREDLDQMIALGMLEASSGAPVAAVNIAGPVAEPAHSVSALFERASPELVASPSPSTQPPAALSVPSTNRTAQQRYQDAYPIATRLTGALGLRGFRLNLSVEGTSNYAELLALAPKIRSAVGPEKSAELDRALEG